MVLQKTVSKPGFDLVYKGDLFKCAIITKSAQYAVGQVLAMKRHNESDEVFVLVQGKAALLTGDPIQKQYVRTELKSGVSYCVEAGTWHYLAISEDALVFVTENSSVSSDNTDELNVEDQNLTLEV